MVTDHIVPHQGDRTLMWAIDNWQPCCAWHHDVVKQRLEVEWRNGRLQSDALRLDSAQAIALTRELGGT